jgi:GTP cyclohydrolase II
MFSYVYPSIRVELEAEGRLVALDHSGNPVPANARNAFISVLGPVPIPRLIGNEEVTLDWYPFVRRTELPIMQEVMRRGGRSSLREIMSLSMSVNSVFAFPGLRHAATPLVRIHSCCLTGDVFGSQRCDCGPQLDLSFERIKETGAGAVVYMSGHEGRGIGLWAKAITYLLQDGGHDTYAANIALGLPEDARDFSDAAVVLRYLLRGRAVRLLSNNPEKRHQLEVHGQPVIGVEALIAGACEHNLRYMREKRAKGHSMPDDL